MIDLIVNVMFGISLSVLLTYAVRQYLFMYTSLKHNSASAEPPPKNLTDTVSILIPAT